MNRRASAYVMTKVLNTVYTVYFSGVISIEHSLSLNLQKDSAQGGDIINGARNKPNQLTLSVIETDTEHWQGWSSDVLKALETMKRCRYLCTVVTSLASYSNMLLTEITVTQDEENQCGWSGDLVFTEYAAASGWNSPSFKSRNNSSTRTNTGSAGTKKVDNPYQQVTGRL